MNCSICTKEASDPVKCSECNFTGCRVCITEWYQLTSRKSREEDSNAIACSCPQCRGVRTFPVEVVENTYENSEDNWVNVGITEGDIISPQQHEIVPNDFKQRWVFQPLTMNIDDVEEIVGYMVFSRRTSN